jgi:hypothetical protein
MFAIDLAVTVTSTSKHVRGKCAGTLASGAGQCAGCWNQCCILHKFTPNKSLTFRSICSG